MPQSQPVGFHNRPLSYIKALLAVKFEDRGAMAQSIIQQQWLEGIYALIVGQVSTNMSLEVISLSTGHTLNANSVRFNGMLTLPENDPGYTMWIKCNAVSAVVLLKILNMDYRLVRSSIALEFYRPDSTDSIQNINTYKHCYSNCSRFERVNTLRPSDVFILQKTRPSLVQIMHIDRTVDRPSFDPVPTYC